MEISDRATPSELDLVRSMADNYDAIVAGIFVRASSGSGRLDLAPQVVRLLQDLSRGSERRNQPFVAMFFGNPYTPMFVPEIPSMMLTYDFSDYAEDSAVRALAGEIAIGGKLPITLPGLFPLGHGLSSQPLAEPRAFASASTSFSHASSCWCSRRTTAVFDAATSSALAEVLADGRTASRARCRR